MRAGLSQFVIARNPDELSKLPFVIGLPINGGLWFKAKDSWPRASRIYCHPLDGRPRGKLAILEEVPVRYCGRRGAAIDLVLDRGVNKRCQFVFTKYRGREIVLWQTPKAVLSARPGARLPRRRLPIASLLVQVDSRERYPYRFRGRNVTTQRAPLAVGDYAVSDLDIVVAAVERKTLEDFTKGLSDGSLAFTMSHLATLRVAAVVVEGTYSRLLRVEHLATGWLAELAARVQARYPSVPIVYAESRKIAEEWTARFLAAALADARDNRLPLDQIPIQRSVKRRKRPLRAATVSLALDGMNGSALMTGTELLDRMRARLQDKRD